MTIRTVDGPTGDGATGHGGGNGVLDELFTDARRRVVLQTVHNCRDLGGYPTETGLVTRWGLLYRADGFHRMTVDDIAIVRSLGLRTVVDLRTHGELEERGHFPHHEIEVDFVHHPILDRTWDEAEMLGTRTDHEFLVHAYTLMLAEGSANFAGAIAQLARPGALPAVFHCAAGKDRTGILAALLLGALGVSRSVLLGDYGLTRDGMVRMRDWVVREFPESASLMAETPSAFLAALPDALGEVLDAVVAEHGSIREYVVSIGVAPEVLDALAATVLQPLG